jgi:hypothetical protein
MGNGHRFFAVARRGVAWQRGSAGVLACASSVPCNKVPSTQRHDRRPDGPAPPSHHNLPEAPSTARSVLT